MGKRTRSTLAYIATRLDTAILELQRLNARLDAGAGQPDDSPFTYISTDTGYIKQINRSPAFAFTVETPASDSRTPIQRAAADAPNASAIYDFASDPKWQTHYLKAQPDGTFQTRERTPADADKCG